MPRSARSVARPSKSLRRPIRNGWTARHSARGRRMDTHYYADGGNVIIDDCSRCELNWLDAGELTAIIHAPDHSLDRRPLTDVDAEPR